MTKHRGRCFLQRRNYLQFPAPLLEDLLVQTDSRHRTIIEALGDIAVRAVIDQMVLRHRRLAKGEPGEGRDREGPNNTIFAVALLVYAGLLAVPASGKRWPHNRHSIDLLFVIEYLEKLICAQDHNKCSSCSPALCFAATGGATEVALKVSAVLAHPVL